MVDPKFAGALHVAGAQVVGTGGEQMTLTELPPPVLANVAAKESQHAVVVVSAVRTADGELDIPANSGSPTWRAWFGRLSTSGPGCFELRMTGEALSEVIVFAVNAGSAPPG